MPDFILDGQVVAFKEGQSIMQAATSAGIYIPHLCFHEDLSAHGSCRVCLVKVNGRFLSACTIPAKQDMEVLNIDDDVQSYRRQLLEMLFVEGNHLCPSCEKSGGCTLQSVAIFCGMLSPQLDFQYPKRTVDASHPDILLDYNRCINCELCSRASKEVDHKAVFSMQGRGIENHLLVNSPSGLLADSKLNVTDRAASVCPVGAILVKKLGFEKPIGAREFDIHPLGSKREDKHDA